MYCVSRLKFDIFLLILFDTHIIYHLAPQSHLAADVAYLQLFHLVGDFRSKYYKYDVLKSSLIPPICSILTSLWALRCCSTPISVTHFCSLRLSLALARKGKTPSFCCMLSWFGKTDVW